MEKPDTRLYLSRLDYEIALKNGSLSKEDFVLGLWCFSNFENIEISQLINYKNNEFSRMACANQNVDKAYSRLNDALSDSLNRLHGVTYGKQYWEILYGYWLRQFLDVLYDRYQTVQEAKRSINSDNICVLLPFEEAYKAPTDTDDFSVSIFTDQFNHNLFGEIIKYFGFFNVKNSNALKYQSMTKVGRKSSFSALKRIIFEISTQSVRLNKVVIVRSYFSKNLLSRLSLRFLSLPLLGTPAFTNYSDSFDLRESFRLCMPPNPSEFESLAVSLVSKYIPKIFIENYKDLVRKGERTRPKKAKVFLSANAFAAQELYKYWVARSTSDGHATSIIVQHGANYGHSEIMSEEQYERRTSNIYTTSGWEDNREPKVKPFIGSAFLGGIGDYWSKKPTNCPTGDIVWVLCSLPRYQYTQWSAPQGPDFITYLDSQSLFLRSLSLGVKGSLLCRSYHYDYGWDDLEYLKKYGGDFRLDESGNPLRKLMFKAKAMVFTYDSTSMMESMALNIPTLCFWDPVRWPWRDDSLELLSELKSAQIFHENARDLASHLNHIGDSARLLEWWQSNRVQKVRLGFCKQYASTSSNEFRGWSNLISSLM